MSAIDPELVLAAITSVGLIFGVLIGGPLVFFAKGIYERLGLMLVETKLNKAKINENAILTETKIDAHNRDMQRIDKEIARIDKSFELVNAELSRQKFKIHDLQG